ncbi:hypothetical protein PIB30_014829 [Stylosanthes scabra]|uniref:NB-ARC domain-containing protein n=1 Tax=Stylosanthes scabra TaxID=79078 RepID=A0ABU6R760_9FABA|nr:hypothetical protein [Stylosanthes scabra]
MQDLILVQLSNYHKVQILGIWGMAGIGKTTMAMALYNQICYRFERRKFVDNISERNDVTELDQLEALCGRREWFGPGSTIIITTRDRNILKDVDDIYTVKEMDHDESIELFCWHAFKNKEIPAEDYREPIECIVEYCRGVPLLLEVAGSHLYGKMIEEWESTLEEKDPPHKLQRFRRVSFDSLRDDSLKKVFLDIVCFFIGMNRNYVVKILKGTGYNY